MSANRRFSIPQIGDRVRVMSFRAGDGGLGTVVWSSQSLTRRRGQYDVLWGVRLDAHGRMLGFQRSWMRIVYRERKATR